ncbi:hypothetical protein FKM82_031260 [Ascaphus truei]
MTSFSWHHMTLLLFLIRHSQNICPLPDTSGCNARFSFQTMSPFSGAKCLTPPLFFHFPRGEMCRDTNKNKAQLESTYPMIASNS